MLVHCPLKLFQSARSPGGDQSALMSATALRTSHVMRRMAAQAACLVGLVLAARKMWTSVLPARFVVESIRRVQTNLAPTRVSVMMATTVL